jgi:hypothetical protein
MTQDITREQAAQITDLESYKRITGFKRLKRTKEEMDSGLTPEEALKRRLAETLGEEVPEALRRGIAQAKAGQLNDGPKPRASASRKGDITLQIRPAAKTDADYFEHVPGKPVEIVLDQSWYSWFDTLSQTPFGGDTTKLLRFILEQGIGQVLTKFHFPEDIEEFERPVRTPDQLTGALPNDS